MRLLNKVKPKPDESLFSFLSRNSKANYYTNVNTLLKENYSSWLYRYNFNYIEDNWALLSIFKPITDALQVDIHELTLNKYNRLFFSYVPLNKMTENSVYNKLTAKYCPSCLQNDYYYRMFWDISFFTTCIKHNCYLVDRCPNCSSKITISRLMYNECQCGLCFSTVISKIPSDLVLKTQVLFQRTLFDPEFSLILPEGQNLEASEYIFLLLTFCNMIDNLPGSIFYKQTGIYKPFVSYKFNTKEERDVLMMSLLNVVAHQLISEPNIYLPQLLLEIDKIKDHAVKISAKRAMNVKRYNLLKKIIEFDKGDFYYNCYFDYVNGLTSELINKRTIIKFNTEKKKYLSTTEVIKLLKKDFNVVTHFCEIGMLTAYRTRSNSLLIEKSSVLQYLFIKKTSFKMAQLCKYLGVHYSRVIELFDKGLLRAHWGPKTNGYKLWHFDKAVAVALIESILAKSIFVESPPPNHIPLKKVLNILVQRGISFTEIVTMIIHGTFSTVCLKNTPNLKGIYIPIEEIHRLLKQVKSSSPSQ
jgi:hypothetical protein